MQSPSHAFSFDHSLTKSRNINLDCMLNMASNPATNQLENASPITMSSSDAIRAEPNPCMMLHMIAELGPEYVSRMNSEFYEHARTPHSYSTRHRIFPLDSGTNSPHSTYDLEFKSESLSDLMAEGIKREERSELSWVIGNCTTRTEANVASIPTHIPTLNHPLTQTVAPAFRVGRQNCHQYTSQVLIQNSSLENEELLQNSSQVLNYSHLCTTTLSSTDNRNQDKKTSASEQEQVTVEKSRKKQVALQRNQSRATDNTLTVGRKGVKRKTPYDDLMSSFKSPR